MVGMCLPHKPAASPPAMLPSKYGMGVAQFMSVMNNRWVKETRQMGRIMETEQGNISSSSRLPNMPNSGTSTMPPPAPNMPLIAPAQNPAIRIPGYFFMQITKHRICSIIIYMYKEADLPAQVCFLLFVNGNKAGTGVFRLVYDFVPHLGWAHP